MLDLLTTRREAIAEICRRYDVRLLAVFGSAATDDFDPERSDVDLLVEFESVDADLFDSDFGLREKLTELFGRPVDLVIPSALRNPYFASAVDESRRDLYVS